MFLTIKLLDFREQLIKSLAIFSHFKRNLTKFFFGVHLFFNWRAKLLLISLLFNIFIFFYWLAFIRRAARCLNFRKNFLFFDLFSFFLHLKWWWYTATAISFFLNWKCFTLNYFFMNFLENRFLLDLIFLLF